MPGIACTIDIHTFAMGNSNSSSSSTSPFSESSELNNNGDCQPSNTASKSRSIVQQSFTTTHDFEVPNYQTLPGGMGMGWFARSSTFRAGGHRWHVRLYPDGCNKHCAGSTSAFLVCVLGLGERHAPEVRTRFSLNVLQKEAKEEEGRPEASDKLTDFPVIDGIFSPTADNKEFDYGYPVFFDNSKLVPSKHLDDDGCLTVRCVLTVIKNKKSAVVAPPPKPDLQEQLARMLKDGEGADVTFSVGGRLFPAHKCLLAARSPVFRAKLFGFGPMKEDSSTRCVQIDDVEPAIFEALLHFLYTDCMTDEYKEGETENLQHLLVAADRFGVDRLRVLCEGRLCNSIIKSSVATTLVLAELQGCKALRKACIKFMARSRATLRAVSKTVGYSHLVASCPNLVLEILSVVGKLPVSEMAVVIKPASRSVDAFSKRLR